MAAAFADHAKDSLIAELEELRENIRQLAEPLSNERLWRKPLEPGNAIGHLILHLTGNLNHFVGAQLGKSGYIRDREREFTEANRPTKDKLLADLDAAVAVFRRVVSGLTEAQLLETHPEAKLGSVYKALVHLVAHFAVHRGQMSYLNRLVNS